MAYRDAQPRADHLPPDAGPVLDGNFLSVLGEPCDQPATEEKELRRRILSAFDDRMLLIVDGCHRSMFSRKRLSHPGVRPGAATLRLRRVCAARTSSGRMERGYLADIMRQTKRRRLCAADQPSDART